MAIISDLPDEPESSTAPSTNGEEDVLSSLLAKKGPLSLLETVFDLIRKQSDLFKDPTVVSKIASLASAAKAKDDAEMAAERKKKEAATKAKEAKVEKKSVEKPVEVDTEKKSESESLSKKAKVDEPEDDGKNGRS
jgi:hypothetical protein